MKKNIYWGIFLISMATLIWEILLTRIFSATMYYHFVFMSISLAMLGFGGSGIMVYFFPRFFSKKASDNQLASFSLLFSAAMVLAITVYLSINFTPTVSRASLWNLCKIFSFIFLPYVFSGFTVTLALKHYAQQVTRLYCYDLVGAGLGCVLVVGLLFIYDGLSLVLLTACCAAFSSVLFARSCSARVLKTLALSATVLLFMAFICNAYLYRFLKIRYVQGQPEAGVLFEKWNPINRVTVLPSKFFDNDVLIITPVQ